MIVNDRKKMWGKDLHLSSSAFYEAFLSFPMFKTAQFIVSKRYALEIILSCHLVSLSIISAQTKSSLKQSSIYFCCAF